MLLPLIAMMTVPDSQATFYIGTYTSKDGSKGIYRAQLNTENGMVSTPKLVAEAPSPSFVAVHPNGKFLYATYESTGGDVAAYAIDGDNPLKLLNKQSSKGGGPCHVSVDAAGKTLFVANYGGGSIASFPIQADGSLGVASSSFQSVGSGPDKSRQGEPHMHSIYPDAKRKLVFACDLGTDDVYAFRMDGGSLKLTESRGGKVSPGGGPRHLAIHPKMPYVYVNNEMTATVSVMSLDAKTGGLKEVQVISTLPTPDTGIRKSTAEIALHPNGKFLYVSNRGHDSVAAYTVGKDGRLQLVSILQPGVKEPRGFDIDPTGKWLVVGGQNSGEIKSLKIDSKTGSPSSTGFGAAVSRPVCIAFVK